MKATTAASANSSGFPLRVALCPLRLAGEDGAAASPAVIVCRRNEGVTSPPAGVINANHICVVWSCNQSKLKPKFIKHALFNDRVQGGPSFSGVINANRSDH